MTADEMAADYFPEEWARVAAETGKKARRQRHALRRRAEYEHAMSLLVAEGRSCSGCDNFVSAPPGLSFKKACDARSDFHGYVEAKADGLCPQWRVPA